LAIEDYSRDCPPGGGKQNAAQSNSTSHCFGHGERRKNGRQLSTDVDGNSDQSANPKSAGLRQVGRRASTSVNMWLNQ